MGFLRRLWESRVKDRERKAWRHSWAEAVAAPDRETIRALGERLDRLAAANGDLEIEREMLDGLDHMVRFASEVAREGLPALATGHRVVGTDVCHFIAPASMPDDPAQPSGRLLLTNARAIFVGGARGITVPWHAIAQQLQTDRDIVLVRSDGAALYRFRCNSFDDALRGAFIAGRLRRKEEGKGERAGGRRI